MQLIVPTAEFETSYRQYIQELGSEERYPFPLDFDHSDFPTLLARLDEFRKGVNLPEGYVRSTTYWLVQDGELMGVSNLRHYLNDRIRHVGGHIGLGVRPSRRGRGLGSALLGLTLQQARQLGIAQVHVHCYKHNEASARMIRANGGWLESEIEADGKLVQRYLID